MRVVLFVLFSSFMLCGCLAGAAVGAAGAVVGTTAAVVGTTASVAVKTTGAVVGAVTPGGDEKPKEKSQAKRDK
jgi:hypothetical protein